MVVKNIENQDPLAPVKSTKNKHKNKFSTKIIKGTFVLLVKKTAKNKNAYVLSRNEAYNLSMLIFLKP